MTKQSVRISVDRDDHKWVRSVSRAKSKAKLDPNWTIAAIYRRAVREFRAREEAKR